MSPEHDMQLETVLGEYLRRIDAGEKVNLDQLFATHPGIAADLASCLEAASLIQRMAGRPDREGSGQGGDTSIVCETVATAPEQLRDQQASFNATQAPNRADSDGKHIFGRFEILSELGQGAMGTVYLAFDTRLQRQVALKFPKFASENHAALIERFYREARWAATLRHPNICPVFDADCIDGVHFIAMAYIQGRPLSAYIDRRSPPSPRNAALTVRKIARAVYEAHKHGVVHRDLKPSNIVIDDRNEPIVMDFGLARVFDQPSVKPESRPTSTANLRGPEQTQDGAIVGTPRYMSPEQARGAMDAIGPASDQFSLGILFYEMLTGRPPFEGENLTTLLSRIVSHEPPPPSALRPAVDPALDAICLRMIQKRPENRYPSLQDAAEAIAAAVQQAPAPVVSGSQVAAAQASARGSSRWKKLLAMAVAAAAVLLATIIIRQRTADGTLVVEIDHDAAEVQIVNDSGAVEITRTSDGQTMKLSVAPGTHRLMIEKDGFRAYSEKLEIAAGKSTTIRARLEPLPTAPSVAAPPATFVTPAKAESQRDLARWLLGAGAKVEVVDLRFTGSPKKWCANTTSLPDGPLQIKSVAWESERGLPEFSDEDTLRLTQCVDLDHVHIKNQRLSKGDWLAAFPQLRYLRMDGGEVSPRALSSMGQLQSVRVLSFESYPRGLTPEGLSFIRRLPDLEEVWFNAATAGDGTLAHLAELQKLKTVVLWAAGVTDAGLVHLAKLERLEYLQLGENPITQSGLRALGKAPSLRTLGLAGSSIDDAALKALRDLPWAAHLDQLWLPETTITNEGAKQLASIKNLEVLDLTRTKIDDQAVPYLSRLTKLKQLKLNETNFSSLGGEELARSLPGCAVEFPPDLPLAWQVRYFSWPDAGLKEPPRDWVEVIGADPLDKVEEAKLTHDWGWNAPANSVPADHFALVATSEVELRPGDYRLEVSSDDGVRVFFDDRPVLEAWTWRIAKTDSVELAVSEGRHRLRVEYFEIDGGASLSVRLLPRLSALPAGFGSEFLVTASTGARDIFRYKLATKEWENLTKHSASDVSPVWSRDGRQIAFVSNRDGGYRLHVMDADGRNVTQVTPHPCSYYSGPTWSPDGKRLAVFAVFAKPQLPESWLIDIDGSQRTTLSNQEIWDLTWSPDGKRLAFAIKKAGGFRLGLMDADGLNYHELNSTDNPFGFVCPAWSPDSQHIAFADWIDGGLHVCVVDVDGSNLRVLTKARNCFGPAFSTDGKSILYQQRSSDTAPGRVFVVNALGGEHREFAWPGGLDRIIRGPFAWRPESNAERSAASESEG